MKKIKNIILFVIILALLGVAYYLFFGKVKAPTPVAPTSDLQSSATGVAPINSVVNPTPINEVEATKISQEFINQLLNLQAIKLKDDIFSSLAFQSLQDFSITLIQPGNEGRPNPFAPFGADALEPGTTSTPSGVIIPGGAGTTSVWVTAPLGSMNIFYDTNWGKTEWKSGQPEILVGYHFAFPSSVATLDWGGPQATCNPSSFPAFAYGVSTRACVKGRKAELTGGGAESTFSTAEKNAFGDFVQKNS